MDQVALHTFIASTLSKERYADPARLQRSGHKVYSQTDEDGILAEIFRRIGISERTFVEFGVSRGVQCNTVWLLMQGWRGLWIEGNDKYVTSIRTSHRSWIESSRLRLRHATVTAENINAILIDEEVSEQCDLLSIDIDYNDYWVWKAITCVRPRVVVVEYNAAWPPPASVTVPYDANGSWKGNSMFGASLSALAALGEAKGYRLVGCTLSGVNAFFVREDLCPPGRFTLGSAEDHYEPPRYFLAAQESGHPPAVGELSSIEQPVDQAAAPDRQ